MSRILAKYVVKNISAGLQLRQIPQSGFDILMIPGLRYFCGKMDEL